MDRQKWVSPSKGILTLDGVVREMQGYISEMPGYRYELRVGTDSQRHGRHYVFVSSIVIRRVGKGARYFYNKTYRVGKMDLVDRMWEEATRTSELCVLLYPKVTEARLPVGTLLADIDVGEEGETRKLITAIAGMVTAYGFRPVTKPDSIAASCVADKFVRGN